MSSPEFKRVEEPASEPTAAQIPSYIVRENGGTRFDAREALSSRFDSLTLVRVSGNSIFYLARDVGSSAQNSQVLLQVFSGEAAGRELELFQLETSSAAKLSHRNIIFAGPSQLLNGVHFCVLEHRSGAETLKDLLDREGWLDHRLAIGIVHQIVDALEYAHDADVLHLQIQPENILIEPDGTAVLTGFGIDRDVSWARIARSEFCPIRYASPEQAAEQPPDFRSDLYSLGVVLYKMLTDRLPVDSQDPDSVRQKHLSQSPVSPHLFCPDIPVSLSTAIGRLLEKEPDRRFQQISDLRIALQESLSEPPATSRGEDALLLSEDSLLDGEDILQLGEDALPQKEGEDRDLEQASDDPSDDPPALSLGAWETPTVMLLNDVADDTAELQSDPIETKEQLPEPSESHLQQERSINHVAARDLTFQSATRAQLTAPILVVVLALVAIGALMALAWVDRGKTPKQPAPSAVKPESATTPDTQSAAAPADPASSALSPVPAVRPSKSSARRVSGSSTRRQRKRTWRSPRYRRSYLYRYRQAWSDRRR